MALANQGLWEDLADCCRICANLHILSLKMDGKHYYSCGKYPLRENEVCPKFVRVEE